MAQLRREERTFSRNEAHCAIRLKILHYKHLLVAQSHPSQFWLLLVAGTIDIRTQKVFGQNGPDRRVRLAKCPKEIAQCPKEIAQPFGL